MIKHCLTLIAIVLRLLLQAQEYPDPPPTPAVKMTIENLEQTLRRTKEDSSRILLLYEITTWYSVNYSLKAKLEWGNRLYTEALTANFPKGLCLAFYYRCSYYNMKDSIEKIAEFAHRTIALAEQIDFTQGKGLGYLSLASYYIRIGDFNSIYENSLKAMSFLEKAGDKRNYMHASSMAGAACYRLGKYREALNHYYTAVNGWKELGGRQYEGAISIRMADIFQLMGGNEIRAVEYCKRSAEVFASINYSVNVLNNRLALGNIYLKSGKDSAAQTSFMEAERMNNDPLFWQKVKHNSGWSDEEISQIRLDYVANIRQSMGMLFFETDQYDKALNHFTLALDHFRNTEDSVKELPELYAKIATVYFRQGVRYAASGNLRKADSCYQLSRENNVKAINGYDKNPVKRFPGESLMQMAEICNARGEKMAARKYLYESLNSAKKFNARPVIARAYLLISRQDSANGDFNGAYTNYKLYQAYTDSIAADEIMKKTEAANIREDFRKMEEAIELSAVDNKRKMTRQRQKRDFAYLLSGLVIIGSGYGVYRYRRLNRNKMEQRRLKERLSISQDLHDQVGSTLSSISVFSKVAQLEGERGNAEKMNDLLDRIRSTSGKIMSEMNDIVWAINPRNDTMEKIIQRMESFARPLLAARNIQFSFSCDPSVTGLNLDMEMRKNFYLIFKESVNNAIKYSAAVLLETSITCRQGSLELMVKDNGVGFIPQQEMNRSDSLSGNGLKNMYARAREMNAYLRIDSETGKGTTVTLIVPLL